MRKCLMGKCLIVSLWLMMGQIAQQKDKENHHIYTCSKNTRSHIDHFPKGFQKKSLEDCA